MYSPVLVASVMDAHGDMFGSYESAEQMLDDLADTAGKDEHHASVPLGLLLGFPRSDVESFATRMNRKEEDMTRWARRLGVTREQMWEIIASGSNRTPPFLVVSGSHERIPAESRVIASNVSDSAVSDVLREAGNRAAETPMTTADVYGNKWSTANSPESVERQRRLHTAFGASGIADA